MGGRSKPRPADVIAPNLVLGKSEAFDLSVTSLLKTQVFQEASVTAGSAALAAQTHKHRSLHTSGLGQLCLVDKWVSSLESL